LKATFSDLKIELNNYTSQKKKIASEKLFKKQN